MTMLSRLLIAMLTAAALGAATLGYAQKAEYGTAAEAKAMLEKTVAAIKADKAKALAMINKGREDSRTAISIQPAQGWMARSRPIPTTRGSA
jgi:hypothetical protein